MKIAILGWGSLVWDVGTLKDHLENDGNFEQGGPELPIEFSRISVDGRLTLVIDKKNGAPVLTRVAISKQSDLKEAVKDLWIREGRLNDSSDVRSDAWGKNKEDGRIGYTDRDGKNASVNDLPKDKLTPDHQLAHEHIIGWLPKSNFDAVVWTALASNYKEKIGRDFSVEDAVKYLEDLPEKPTEPRMASRKDALDYIRRAPVITPLRIRLKDLLDGKRAEATATQNTETQSVPGTETQARPTTEPAQAQSETFTSAETEELKTQLEEERRRAAYWGGVNCTWDLTFKVVLLILGVVSATVAGLIATIWKPGSPPHWAKL